MVFQRRVKVVLSIILSYCFTSFLVYSLYPQKTAIPNWVRFSIVTNIYKEQIIQFTSSIITLKAPQIKDTGVLVSEKLYPTPIINSSQSFDFQSVDQTADVVFQTANPTVYPTSQLLPTETPIPTAQPPPPTPIEIYSTPIPLPTYSEPTQAIIKPTKKPEEPTDMPTPTKKISVVPTAIIIPTVVIPTIAAALPTTAPLPPVDASLIVANPLSQPYYQNSIAYKCYTPSRMIQLYANNASQSNCYAAVQTALNSQIVSMSLLGRTIRVNKRVLPAFQAVSKELDRYPHTGTTYTFPSKTYRIETEGAYVFRCNVNASTSGRNDICSSGCVLSMHSFGIAVDINYEGNCNGCANYDMPKEMVEIFEKYGFRWGGRYKSIFNSNIDAMHFEYLKEACEGY